MNELLLWVGRIAGIAGILLCGVAGLARISGYYWLGNFQVGTLLLAGMAIMIAGCFGLLAALTGRSNADR